MHAYLILVLMSSDRYQDLSRINCMRYSSCNDFYYAGIKAIVTYNNTSKKYIFIFIGTLLRWNTLIFGRGL